MLANIKTSKANKAVVTKLTQKLNLGAENLVARLAFSYSMNKSEHLQLNSIQDSNGKEYSPKVLFGNYEDIYVSLVAMKYNVHSSDKNIQKYVKMHIDHGLELIDKAFTENDQLAGTDFLINEIEQGVLQQ